MLGFNLVHEGHGLPELLNDANGTNDTNTALRFERRCRRIRVMRSILP